MTSPVRLQLSRAKGFKLQEHSHSVNGLECVRVSRPSDFGNPFTIEGCREAGYQGSDDEIAARCVSAFKVWLGPLWRNNWDGKESAARRDKLLARIPELRGKNLACWCKIGRPCHADVLLELANGEDEAQ
jgi:hypothetical protein